MKSKKKNKQLEKSLRQQGVDKETLEQVKHVLEETVVNTKEPDMSKNRLYLTEDNTDEGLLKKHSAVFETSNVIPSVYLYCIYYSFENFLNLIKSQQVTPKDFYNPKVYKVLTNDSTTFTDYLKCHIIPHMKQLLTELQVGIGIVERNTGSTSYSIDWKRPNNFASRLISGELSLEVAKFYLEVVQDIIEIAVKYTKLSKHQQYSLLEVGAHEVTTKEKRQKLQSERLKSLLGDFIEAVGETTIKKEIL